MSAAIAVNVINIISDSINYPMFFILNMIIEIYSNVLFKETLDEKLKQVTDPQTKEKIEMQNAKSIKRNNRMVFWNITAELFLKLPVVINVILETISAFLVMSSSDEAGRNSIDIYNFYLGSKIRLKNNFNHFCIQLNGCQMLEDVFNVLFLFYLSLPLLFYYKYDLNFKKWFQNLFQPTIPYQQPNKENESTQQSSEDIEPNQQNPRPKI